MKQPFRYYRGEFTKGKYLHELVRLPNFALTDILDELVYQMLFQWKLENEIVEGEMAIRNEDILGIAQTAGLFRLNIFAHTNLGSIYLSRSHIVNNAQRSERGLVDMRSGHIRYVRTQRDNFPDSISNEATPGLRAGLIPDGQEPVGYVLVGTDTYTEEGDIIWENILSEPPTDGTPYEPLYDERFLTLERFSTMETSITIEVFKQVFRAAQYIRYNGPTLKAFMEITNTLVDGHIYNVEIILRDGFYVVYYQVNTDSSIMDREERLTAWKFLCGQKFKLCELTEVH